MISAALTQIDDAEPSIWSRILAAVVSVVAIIGGICTAFLIALFAWSTAQLPEIDAHSSASLSSSSIVYSSDGVELARFHRERREPVSLEHVPAHFIDALLATEDRRFYRHRGVDWRRIATASLHSITGSRQGGSTLTMQLARNHYTSIAEAPLLLRKAQEILMAHQLERIYEKDQILEMYVNDVPFGQRAYGIKAATTAYFNKDLSDLTMGDAATLVAILKGSTYYNPMRNPERATARRNLVLSQLEDEGVLSPAEVALHRHAPLHLSPNSQSMAGSISPHAVRHVEQELGTWAKQSNIDLYADGLRIHTTLNTELQHLANEAVRSQLEQLQAVVDYEWGVEQPAFLGPNTAHYRQQLDEQNIEPFSYLWDSRGEELGDSQHASLKHSARQKRPYREAITTLQSGFVALDPQSGRVQAWVGSRDFMLDQYDHVAQAHRQPGSTFKPFVFAAAVDRGYHPDDRWADGTVQPASTSENAGLRLREGLAYSNNALALHLTETISPSSIARTAHQMGIESELRAFPSLAFGTSEVSLLELVSSYGTMANDGQVATPRLIDRVEDADGHLLYQPDQNTRRGSSAHTSYAVIDMMRDVVNYGTGRDIRERFGIASADLAGKTGTTQNNADGWFVMAHPHLVMGSWVGFNDRQIGFRSEYWGRGSSNALRVVGDFARAALNEGHLPEKARFQRPVGYEAPRLHMQATQSTFQRDGYYNGWPGVPRHEAPSADSGMDSSDPTYVRDSDAEAALRRSMNAPSGDEN